MGAIGWSEAIAIAGVVAAVGAGYAIPFGVWMFKISSGLRLVEDDLNGKGGVKDQINRVESDRYKVTSEVFGRIGATEGHLAETREIVGTHAVRITQSEKEIQRLRDKNTRRGDGDT